MGLTEQERLAAADALERGLSLHDTLLAVSAGCGRELTPAWVQALGDAADAVWPTLTLYSREPDMRWGAFSRLCERWPAEAARRLRAAGEG